MILFFLTWEVGEVAERREQVPSAKTGIQE